MTTTANIGGNNSNGKQFYLAALFTESNRGILFDVVIFLINAFLMHLLVSYFLQLAEMAGAGDDFALFGMTVMCAAIFVLPPAGAVLKRWHFHRRLSERGVTIAPGDSYLRSCLFNPIFYLALNLVIVSAFLALISHFIFGRKEPSQAVFVPMVISGTIFAVLQTVLVYRYFTPPKRAPRSGFLRDPRSELIGDICIFVNMLFFQVAWNLTARGLELGPPMDWQDVLFRLFMVIFVALLIYFPPRMLFLAEDVKKPAAWFTILLANAPIIYRIVAGSEWN